MIKRLFDFIISVFEWLARAVVLWVPLALLLVVSALYLLSCAETALAPGAPVAFQYEGAGGRYRLEAEGYSVDLANRSATLHRIQLRSPGGPPMLKIGRLKLAEETGVIRAEASNAEAWIERYADRFSIESALPKQTGERGDTPFEVQVSNSKVHYQDASRSPSLPGEVEILHAQIAGVGPDFMARAKTTLNRAPVDLEVTMGEKEGWEGRASWTLAETSSWLLHIKRWLPAGALSQVQDLRSQTLKSSGLVRLAQGKGKPIEGEGSALLRAEGVRWTDLVRQGKLTADVRWLNDALWTNADIREPGRSLQFKGTTSWRKAIQAEGEVAAKADSNRSLWVPLQRALPRELSGQGLAFRGHFRWDDGKYALKGDLDSRRVGYQGRALSGVSSKALFTEKGLALDIRRGAYQRSPVTGFFDLQYRDGAMRGFARAKNVPLSEAGVRELNGTANVTLALKGTTRKPTTDVSLQGQGNAMIEGQKVAFSSIQGGGTLQGNEFRLKHLLARGPQGTIGARGRMTLNGRMDLDVAAKGLDLARFGEDVSGKIDLSGRLSGRMSAPTLEGRIQGEDVTIAGRKVPRMLGNLTANRDRIFAQDVILDDGIAQLKGQLAYEFKGKKLTGTASAANLQMITWAKVEGLRGFLNSDNIEIAGTLARPLLKGKFNSDFLLYHGFEMDHVSGDWSYDGNIAMIRAKSPGLSLDGRYDIEQEFGEFSLIVDDLAVETLTQNLPELGAEGELTGRAILKVRKKEVESADLDLIVKNLQSADIPLGSGRIRAKGDKGNYEGSFSLGMEDRFLLGEGIRYSTASKEVGGRLDAFNFPVTQALKSSHLARTMKNLDPTLYDLIQRTRGSLTMRADVGGTTDNLAVDVPSMNFDDVHIGEMTLGTISAKGSRKDGATKLDQLSWRSGTESLEASGTISKGEALNLAVQLNRVQIGRIKEIYPAWAVPAAEATLFADVKGTLSKPEVNGSLDLILAESSANILNPNKIPPSISLFPFNFVDGVLTAEGKYSVEAFTGAIKARVPLVALDARQASADLMKVEVEVDERQMKDFAEVIEGWDAARTTGSIKGSLTLTGTSGDYSIDGRVGLFGGTLALNNVQTVLQDTELRLSGNRNEISLKGSAKGSQGGTLDLDLLAKVSNPFATDMTFNRWLREANISGKFRTNDLRIAETSKDQNLTVRIAPSEILFSGSLLQPEISGALLLADLNTTIPEAPESTERSAFTINPIFKDFTFAIQDRATVRTSTATIVLKGGGAVRGELASLRADAELQVEDGLLSLPNARVNLETGKLRFRYNASLGERDAARLDVINLEGRTAISARRVGDAVERYDITLLANGNLLQDGGLNLFATSDPADLTSQEILAILGQKELIEDFARGTIGGDRNRPLSDLAIQLALPSLTGGLTQGIASTFKLDYLAVEHNPFDQYVFSAGKTLGKGLSLNLRRQVTSQSNRPLKYDLRLVYRIPSRDRFVSRLRLGFGIDERRPWRFTIDYIRRF